MGKNSPRRAPTARVFTLVLDEGISDSLTCLWGPPQDALREWARRSAVGLGADGIAAALAEVVVQLAVGKDQEQPLPHRHRLATGIAIEVRRLQLLELFVHGPHRNDPPDYGPPDRGCQGWGRGGDMSWRCSGYREYRRCRRYRRCRGGGRRREGRERDPQPDLRLRPAP